MFHIFLFCLFFWGRGKWPLKSWMTNTSAQRNQKNMMKEKNNRFSYFLSLTIYMILSWNNLIINQSTKHSIIKCFSLFCQKLVMLYIIEQLQIFEKKRAVWKSHLGFLEIRLGLWYCIDKVINHWYQKIKDWSSTIFICCPPQLNNYSAGSLLFSGVLQVWTNNSTQSWTGTQIGDKFWPALCYINH